MEETKRTMEDVSRDYSGLCTKAGDLQYKIRCFSEELNQVNEGMRSLNQEAAEIQKEVKSE